MSDNGDDADSQDVRARILTAASALVASGGVAALTTRAVAAAAAVQAPTLYRLFGDKRGLLAAVAEHGLAAFVANKVAAEPSFDPVQDLSEAWDDYIAFGLANPAVFAIMHEVGAPLATSPAALSGIAVLRRRVERIARAGRLLIPIERAVSLIHAMGVGTVTTLLATPPGERDTELGTIGRETMLAAVAGATGASDDTGLAPAANAVLSQLGEVEGLSPGERLLMAELLRRIGPPTCALDPAVLPSVCRQR